MSKYEDIDENNNDIKLQIIDWREYHETNDEGDLQYTIRLFGRTWNFPLKHQRVLARRRTVL